MKDQLPWLTKIRQDHDTLGADDWYTKADNILIGSMTQQLKDALDEGLKNGLSPQGTLDEMRTRETARGHDPNSLTMLAVWAYLEQQSGQKFTVEGGEDVAF